MSSEGYVIVYYYNDYIKIRNKQEKEIMKRFKPYKSNKTNNLKYISMNNIICEISTLMQRKFLESSHSLKRKYDEYPPHKRPVHFHSVNLLNLICAYHLGWTYTDPTSMAYLFLKEKMSQVLSVYKPIEESDYKTLIDNDPNRILQKFFYHADVQQLFKEYLRSALINYGVDTYSVDYFFPILKESNNSIEFVRNSKGIIE